MPLGQLSVPAGIHPFLEHAPYETCPSRSALRKETLMDGLDLTFSQQQDRIVAEWKKLLSFKSISTDPEHEHDCLACAEWLREHLAQIGFKSELLETGTKPLVFAERQGAEGAPTILFYGHYDVQPVDPVEAWDSPPFEAEIRDGRMYARGAQDNKGQHFYVLKALEQLIKEDRLIPTVKIFLEGEEECGSTGITSSMQAWKERLRSDILLVTDLGMAAPDQPTLTMSLRGIIHATAELSGPRTDLHSGMHGGLAPNPATALCRLLTTLHDENGAIAIPAFYEGIQPTSAAERSLAAAVPFDAERYRYVFANACTSSEGFSYTRQFAFGFSSKQRDEYLNSQERKTSQ